VTVFERMMEREPNMDERLKMKYILQWKTCSKSHRNSPNAKECWKCGEKLVH